MGSSLVWDGLVDGAPGELLTSPARPLCLWVIRRSARMSRRLGIAPTRWLCLCCSDRGAMNVSDDVGGAAPPAHDQPEKGGPSLH